MVVDEMTCRQNDVLTKWQLTKWQSMKWQSMKLAVDKMAVDKMAVDKMAVDKMAVDKMTCRQNDLSTKRRVDDATRQPKAWGEIFQEMQNFDIPYLIKTYK